MTVSRLLRDCGVVDAAQKLSKVIALAIQGFELGGEAGDEGEVQWPAIVGGVCRGCLHCGRIDGFEAGDCFVDDVGWRQLARVVDDDAAAAVAVPDSSGAAGGVGETNFD